MTDKSIDYFTASRIPLSAFAIQTASEHRQAFTVPFQASNAFLKSQYETIRLKAKQ